FRETGHADQQGVTAGEDRNQRALHHHILAENDGTDRCFRSTDMGGRGFSRTYDHVFQFFQTLAAGFRHDVDSFRRPIDAAQNTVQQTRQGDFAALFGPNLPQSPGKLTLSSGAGPGESRRCEQARDRLIIEGKQWRRQGRAGWTRSRQGCPAKTRAPRPSSFGIHPFAAVSTGGAPPMAPGSTKRRQSAGCLWSNYLHPCLSGKATNTFL